MEFRDGKVSTPAS